MEKGQTSREFLAWANDMFHLPVPAQVIKEISDSSKPTAYLNQCVVLKCLVDCTALIVEQWWIDEIEEANYASALEVGQQLLGVLKRGLQLLQQCVEEEESRGCRIVGCAGEFFEIIDDVEMYSQMMNKLAKEQVSEELQEKVKEECMMMRDALKSAVERDGFVTERDSIGLENKIPDTDLLIQSHLGKGRFGTVSKALWRKKVPVAIKEFFYDRDFEEEYNAFKQLGTSESSHIIQIFGHSEVRGRKAFVMELMDLDLKMLIEKKKRPNSSSPFSVYTAIDIMLQIAKGGRSVCGRGMSHRDMKPSNILLKLREDGSFVVKVADFGIAIADFGALTALQNNEMTGANIGEQLDVYSFGVICLEILTGRPPQPRPSVFDSYEAFLPQHIPQEINELIHSCMSIDAKSRATFSDVYDNLWYLKEMVLIAGIDMQRYNDEEKLKLEKELCLDATDMSGGSRIELRLDATNMTGGSHTLVLDQTYLLGSGTCGSVWKAVWGDRQVAVKRFPKADDFIREFDLLKKATSSSHIVQLLGHLEIEGKKGLIMEFMDKDLRKLMEERKETSPPFSFYDSSDILLQIAEGARSLHEIDLIHRDIKPSNVLVKNREDGTFLVKLADFNTSKAEFQTEKSNSNKKGTPLYMAPEMVAATSKYSKKVDVYSFGILCIEILTGKMDPKMHEILGKEQFNSILQAIPMETNLIQAIPMETNLIHAIPMEPKDNWNQGLIEGLDKKVVKPIEDSRDPSKENTSLLRVPMDHYKIIRSCLELEAQKRPTFEELCCLFRELRKKYEKSPVIS